jgi:integrase
MRQRLLDHRSRSRDHSPDALVFATRKGTPLSPDNLRNRDLKPACKRAELNPIDWHTLRRTHSTLLHALGTPLKVAQAQLGHSRMATTLEVYTHALPDAQREAVTKLEGILFPSVPKLHQEAAEGSEETPPIP